MMAGEPEGTDEGPTWRDDAEITDVTAPRAGLFVETALEPGEWVRRNQPLGHLLCDDDLSTVPLHAPVDGRLEAYGCHRAHCDVSLAAMHPYAASGDLLARIVTPH
jgi:predicted deacylase